MRRSRSSSRGFARGAMRSHPYNSFAPMRGGIRL